MLVRWNNPFRELQAFQSQMNRLFDETVGGRRAEEGVAASWAPPVDITETKDYLTFHVELPGFKNEDLKLNVENGVLTLEGERMFEQESKEKSYHRVERAYGRFLRSFTLPTNVDPERIQASMNEGILTIEIPKREEAKPKSIPIGAGSGPKQLGGKKAA